MYKYGMRYRGFSPLCQPMDGLVKVEDGDRKYYNYLYYNRCLGVNEARAYDLDYIGMEQGEDDETQ